MEQQEERIRNNDLFITAIWLGLAILAGLLLIFARFTLPFLLNGFSHEGWSTTGYGFTSLLWALAWATAGFLLGFLFGIPKVLQTGTKNASKDNAAAGAGDASAAQNEVSKTSAYHLNVNTNLEEISDWLTKILVGATLTQIVKIPGMVALAARYMAAGIGGASLEAFAAAMVVYFSTLGFLPGMC